MKIFYRPWVQNLGSGWLQIGHKSQRKTVTLQFANRWWHCQIFQMLQCFFCQVQLLVQVSCQYHDWFWSYDNFYLWRIDKRSRNQKYHLLSLPSIWRLGWVRNTKFGTNVSNKMLLNDAKCQGYNFCFWFIQGNPTGGIKLPPPPTLGLSGLISYISILCNMLF